MKLNEKKSKIMIFNFSLNKQFTTRLKMNDEVLPVVNKVKLLGTIISDNLKWNENTSSLIKTANKRLLLLRKATEYTNKIEDLKSIYLSYTRTILEQSCVIWNNRLTLENINDLERVQKNACRIILGNKYENYEESLQILNLDKLSVRREKLCLKFALNCTENPKTMKKFPLKKKIRKNLRKTNKFKINKTNTDRLGKSSVLYLQDLLNKNTSENFKK